MATNQTKPVDKTVVAFTLEGKPVTVKHVFRRRYEVAIGGKVEGYITSKTPFNAGGRMATEETLKALRARLH